MLVLNLSECQVSESNPLHAASDMPDQPKSTEWYNKQQHDIYILGAR